jgi:WD40 repeat protein
MVRVFDAGAAPIAGPVLAPGGHAFAMVIRGSAKLWWDTGDAKAVELETQSATAIAFSDDGQWIATTRDDGTIGIWRASDGVQLFRLDAGVALSSVAWSHDRTRLAVGGAQGLVQTFDLSPELRDPDAVSKIVQPLAPRAEARAAH